MQSLFEKAPDGIQVVLISATMSINVFNASKKFMHEPIMVLLKNNEVVVDLISQFYLDVESEEAKFDTLLDLYNLVSTSQAIIFCNTIRKVEWLEQNLKQNNFPITVIHSNMNQSERDNVVKNFRDGKTRLLLTTDLLSRGIDVPQVNLVINYDLPLKIESYIHRIGRSGRYGRKGVAINFNTLGALKLLIGYVDKLMKVYLTEEYANKILEELDKVNELFNILDKNLLEISNETMDFINKREELRKEK